MSPAQKKLLILFIAMDVVVVLVLLVWIILVGGR